MIDWQKRFYSFFDLFDLQKIGKILSSPMVVLASIDELLKRDALRQKDGFPRKVSVGRIVKPGRGGSTGVKVVPTTIEEKLLHDNDYSPEEDSSGGTGDEQEGEIIGEQPVKEEQGGQAGPGQGEGGEHEIDSNAFELGRRLTEKFKLPNLNPEKKTRVVYKYTYDLTDRHRGFGQLLDKKATLKKIIETNLALGNIPDVSDIDPQKFLVAPHDKIYRVLSPEKDYEAQAMVFFLRDYSGSMDGQCTSLVVAQHVMIYSWLLYQYAMQVETRFILHDTEAKEVPDFDTYYNSKVSGGTNVFSAYELVNEIVKKGNLSRDYNIYVFHGTDGDDWDNDGSKTLPHLKKMLTYTNRMGITIVEHAHQKERTVLEKYIRSSGLLEEQKKLLRLDSMSESSDEDRLIEGIKRLVSE